MTTTFTIECTSCHAKFAGKPEYAGRRIRCPKCQEVFRVESPSPANDAPEPTVAVASALAEEFDEWNVPDDFEYKVKETDAGEGAKCKFCHEPMGRDEVLCMKCGYHQKLDKKFETRRGSEADFGEEKPQAVPGRISFGSFSLPTLPLAIAGGVFALFALVVFIVAPLLFALLCFMAGMLLVAIGYFWTLVVAFGEDVAQGLLVFFLPIYWWVYVFTRWDETWLGFAIGASGCLLMFFGIGVFMASTPDMGTGL